MHTRIIPVEKPLLGHHLRPFQLQILYSMGSRKRPGVYPCSSAMAAATEAMRIVVRTIFLRRRWRAPWRITAKNSSSGPVDSFHVFFYFCKALPALVRSATKSCTLVIPELCGGGGQHMSGSGQVYRSTAEFPVKTGLIKLAHNTFSFIFYFDNKVLKSKCREL